MSNDRFDAELSRYIFVEYDKPERMGAFSRLGKEFNSDGRDYRHVKDKESKGIGDIFLLAQSGLLNNDLESQIFRESNTDIY